METTLCTVCQRPKAKLSCELCARTMCKACSNKLPPESFPLLPSVPVELTHRVYCGLCFDEKVAPVLADYEATTERARKVCVFFRKQSQESRQFSRLERPLHVLGTKDRDETLMALAYKAAKAGFNALLDVELDYEKVRNHGFQTAKWKATGIPTTLDVEKLEREEIPGKIMLRH